jgi:hypothetical protein
MSRCDDPTCTRLAVVVVRTAMVRRPDGTWFVAQAPNRFDLCKVHGEQLQAECDRAFDALVAKAINRPPLARQHPQESVMSTKEKCLEPECQDLEATRGFCKKHYQKHYRDGTLPSSPTPAAPVAAPIPSLFDDLIVSLRVRVRAAELVKCHASPPKVERQFYDDTVCDAMEGILAAKWPVMVEQLRNLALRENATENDLRRVLCGGVL